MPQHVTSLVRTAVKTANYTASVGDLVPVDTTSNNVTVTLPTAPANGNRVAVKHIILGTGRTVTVQCGGSDVFNKSGGSTSISLSVLNQAITVQYDSGVWTVVSDDIPLSALSGAYVSSPVPTLAAIGTSITAQCGPITGDATAAPTVQFDALGYLPWALIMAGQRFQWTTNAGVGGNTTSQMLTRFGSDILALNPTPGWLLIEPGPNDAGTASPPAIPAATTIANLTSMIQQAQARGIRVAVGTVTPSTFMSATDQKQARATVNHWIKFTAPTLFPGLVVVDWSAALTDPTTGGPNTAYFQNQSGNYVHPSNQGAAVMGRVLAAALSEVLPARDTLEADAADPYNLLGTAGFTMGNTAGVATGWTITRLDGSALLGATRKVARQDGRAGEWQEITVASGDVQALCQNTNVGVDWAVGDSVYGEGEFYCRDDWANVKDFTFTVEFYNGLGSLNALSIRSLDGNIGFNPRRGVMRTPVGAIPVGCTRLRAKWECDLIAGVPGRATFGFSRVAIRKAGN